MAEELKYTLTTDKGEVLNYSAGFTGKAIAVYPNGDVYDGEFVDGVRQGKGKYTYGTGENPDRFEGFLLKKGIGTKMKKMASAECFIPINQNILVNINF